MTESRRETMGAVYTVDDIMREVIDEIEDGADLKLTDGAKNKFLEKYKPRFKKRLDDVGVEGWNKEEKTVRKAAKTHGKAARLLADLGGKTEINDAILMGLAPLIENQCENIGGKEGAWCSGG
jgi:hypothetical protein